MTKIDIFSGFLGAGKTTLIKKLLKEAYGSEKIVLIENEFGEIGIDGGFLKEAGIIINEINSGCICCSLVGDFGEALKKVIADYSPDRIVIEPSGVGKLSDVIKAVRNLQLKDVLLNGFTTIVDAKKCKMYMKNFGEFFNDQVMNAGCIVLSHTRDLPENVIQECVELLREQNTSATIVTTEWDQLDGKVLLNAMEQRLTIEAELSRLAEEMDDDDDEDEHEHCHHHHDDDDDDDDEDEHEHCHHHHDDDDEDEHAHCHHHHDDDDDDDDEDEHEHCHHHHHHHHHHADEVFSSWGVETARKYTVEEIQSILNELQDESKYGFIVRSKGIVPSSDNKWIYFDYVPGEPDVRFGSADVIGKFCVIGSKIQEESLKALFKV